MLHHDTPRYCLSVVVTTNCWGFYSLPIPCPIILDSFLAPRVRKSYEEFIEESLVCALQPQYNDDGHTNIECTTISICLMHMVMVGTPYDCSVPTVTHQNMNFLRKCIKLLDINLPQCP